MGIEQVFIDTIKENEGLIHKVSKLYTNNTEDQDDLFQEIVIQVWKAFNKFKKDSKISTWIYRIALNTAITGLRKTTGKLFWTLTEIKKLQYSMKWMSAF